MSTTVTFKKPIKLSKDKLRKKTEEIDTVETNELNNHSEDTEEESLLGTIQSVKRKRLVLSKAQTLNRFNRSCSESLETKKSTKLTTSTENTENESKDIRARLQGTFSRKKYSHQSGDFSDDDKEDHEGSVLRQKHKLAMEDFIHQHLESASHQKRMLHSSNSGEIANSLNNESKIDSSILTTFQREADVGAGGAVLGGSGIAEVILPSDSRLQSHEVASSKYEDLRSTNLTTTIDYAVIKKLLPSSFGEGISKKKKFIDGSDADFHPITPGIPKGLISSMMHPSESAGTNANNIYSASSAGQNIRPEDVSNLGRSYSHDYRSHNQERFQIKQELQRKELEMKQGKDKDSFLEADHGRIGFHAIRKGKGLSDAHKAKFFSKDDQCYKNFVRKDKGKH